jgi:hypothetical protein
MQDEMTVVQYADGGIVRIFTTDGNDDMDVLSED